MLTPKDRDWKEHSKVILQYFNDWALRYHKEQSSILTRVPWGPPIDVEIKKGRFLNDKPVVQLKAALVASELSQPAESTSQSTQLENMEATDSVNTPSGDEGRPIQGSSLLENDNLEADELLQQSTTAMSKLMEGAKKLNMKSSDPLPSLTRARKKMVGNGDSVEKKSAKTKGIKSSAKSLGVKRSRPKKATTSASKEKPTTRLQRMRSKAEDEDFEEPLASRLGKHFNLDFFQDGVTTKESEFNIFENEAATDEMDTGLSRGSSSLATDAKDTGISRGSLRHATDAKDTGISRGSLRHATDAKDTGISRGSLRHAADIVSLDTGISRGSSRLSTDVMDNGISLGSSSLATDAKDTGISRGSLRRATDIVSLDTGISRGSSRLSTDAKDRGISRGSSKHATDIVSLDEKKLHDEAKFPAHHRLLKIVSIEVAPKMCPHKISYF